MNLILLGKLPSLKIISGIFVTYIFKYKHMLFLEHKHPPKSF